MFTSFNTRALGLKVSTDETLRLASENGFGGVDLMIRDAIEENVHFPTLRQSLDNLGLQPGAFPFPFDWRRSNEARFALDLDQLASYAEAAAILGSTRTATWVMPETPEVYGDRSSAWDETFQFHCNRLGQIANILDPFNIHLGLEVIGVESSRTGRGVPFIHRLDQLETLRSEIESLRAVPVGVLIDSWHLYASDETITNALAWDIEKIVWVHVADLPFGASTDRFSMVDAVRGLPGEHGAVESRQLLAELKNRGYTGPVTAEPLNQCRSLQMLTPGQVARLAAQSLKSIWPVG